MGYETWVKRVSGRRCSTFQACQPRSQQVGPLQLASHELLRIGRGLTACQEVAVTLVKMRRQLFNDLGLTLGRQIERSQTPP